MTDTYVPSVGISQPSGSRSTAENDADSIAQRVRLITSVNPYMADRPDTLLQMAQSPLPTGQLIDQSGQMYGMMAGDTFATRLKAMDPARQRGIWASMPKSQQLALGQLGYEPPKDRESSWLDKALGPLDEIAAAGVRGIGDVVMPVVSPALKGLTWVGDRPAHLYRTIRLMDDESQWLGLAGAIVGGLAVAAAPVTFGGSLAAAGAIIGGGLIGANAAAGIQNPTDWWNAFGDAYAGERAFDRSSRAKADALLGDPRLIGLAQDVAQLDDFNLGEFARELAGQREVSTSSMTDKVYSLAEKFGAQGTPEYQQAVSSMLNVMNDSTFLEAIKTLQQGKISIGRDVADGFGLDPESGLHTLLSGALDAAWTVAVDPTLMLGSALKWNQARRFGVTLADGSIGAERLLKVAADPRVIRYQEEFLRGFNAQDLQRITSVTPEMTKMVPALSEYARGLQLGEEGLSRPQLLEWLTGSEGLEALLRGQGSVRGAKGIQLARLTPTRNVARQLRLEARVFTGAVNDVRLEGNIRKILADAAESGDQDVIDHMGTWADALINRETGKLYGEHQVAAMAGRGIGTLTSRVPILNRVPELIESMSTMIPAGKAIALTGADAPKDIKALAELGRYMGMPSWARRAWADTILFSDNTGARMNAIHGWLDNALTMAGARNTRRGEELVDRYLEHSLQTYGPDTEHIVNGTAMRRGLFLNENADQIPWPSIRELKDAARTGSILEAIGMDRAALAEFESKAMKVWKPAVLLRIGFIPRASGEEMVNHLFRGGFGSLVQEFGSRTFARQELYKAFALHDADALARVEDLIQDPKVLAKARQQFETAGIEALLPTHIRPLATMLAGRNWAEPVTNVLEHYGTWVNGMLEKGLPVIRGAERPVEGALAAVRGGMEIGARANLARNAESILLGNPTSWRRMMLGGLNDDLADAAIAYQAAYADSLMRHLGTSTAGVWDPGYDPATYQTRQVQRGGKVEEQPVVVLTGQPQLYTNDRWEYAHGVWYQARQPMQDPVAAQIARDYLPRMRAGTNIADDQIDTLFDLTEQMGTDAGRRLMYEFLGADDAGQVRVAVSALRSVDPGLSQHLSRYLSKNGDITIDDVIAGVRKYKGTTEAAKKALLDDLKRVKAIHGTITSLDAASRSYAAVLVRTVDGDDTRTLLDGWRAHRAGGDSPLVGGWGDLDNDIAATYRDGVLNTYNQEKASRSQRLTGLPDGDPMKDGTVLAWRAPSLAGFGSVEEIAALAPDPGVIMRNREAVERLMRDPARRVGMLSDRELAAQLAEATTSPLVAHSLPRRVLNGREEFGGGLIPVVKRTTGDRDEVLVWSADGTMFPSSSAASYQELDDKVAEMAALAQGRTRQLWTKGVRQETRARGRLVRDAEGNESEVAVLYEANPLDARGTVVPIEPGTPLTQDRWYYTRSGKRVRASEPRYTDTVTLDQGEGEVMWQLVGPMIEDSWDARLGLTRFKPKDAVVFGRDGDILASGDVVPVLRSRPGHVMGIEGLPTHATFPTIRAVERTGIERISDYGFNKVLGPAIDRLSRQPMAFHQFQIRYKQARAMQAAFEDPVALERLGEVAAKVSLRSTTPEVESLIDDIRLVAVADAKTSGAERWTDVQVASWLRGSSPQELSDLLDGVAARATTTRGTKQAIERLRAMEPDDVITTLGAKMPTGDDLLAYVRARVPNDDLTSIERFRGSRRAQQVRETNPILSQLDDNDWEAIVTAFNSRSRANTLAGEIAASAAINDIVPFLDSHEFKTQFAQEMQAFLPFHYAEENFIKRWARTFADQGPLSTARKMQLTYAGIKTGGLVRSDAQGNDYFVVPGSGLMIEALSRVFPGAGVLPVGAMLQMSTKSLLPGINEQFGSPSVSPLVSVPLALSEHFFPEMNTVQRVVVGDYASTRSIMQQVVPAHFQRLFEVVGQDENSSARWNSAMLTAIAQLEANDETALPDDATAGQRDEYLRKVREHARIILTSQALAGFFLPTSPQVINTGESGQVDNVLDPREWASNFRKATGYGVDDPRNVLSNLFYGMVSELGIEEGTQQFLATYPNAGLEDITNPLALVRGMSESRSGAPLPATAEAVKFYDDNADYMAAAPYAGPWLMPPADSDQRRVQYAYDQQTINGLRKRETPDDFLTSIKYKEAAGEYFDSRRAYLDMVAQAETNGQDTSTLKAQWDIFATTFKAAHPIFAEQLTSGEGQARRRKVLEEMRVVVADPGAPDSDQLRLLAPVMQSFDTYRLQLAILSDDRSAGGRAKVEQMKLAWLNWLDGYTKANPKASSFVSSVVRPESDLD